MNQGRIIYLDHNATTPVDPLVLAEMLPFFSDQFGNAASMTHAPGHAAQRAVSLARQRVADLIGAKPGEVIWTSGATEANNLATLGIVRPHLARPCHVITQATEHPSVFDACEELRRLGAAVTVLPVDRYGRVSVADVRSALRPETVLVTIMAGNHEIGTIQPIRQIGALCRAAGVLFHTDASQALGKVMIDVAPDCVDLLSLSAHKFYGPKGAGALYIRARSPPLTILPLMFGGGQERGLRPGTLNVPAIVGLGKAAEIAQQRLATDSIGLAALRDRLEEQLQMHISHLAIHGLGAQRLPHVTSVTFADIEGEALIDALQNLAVSSGSACAAARRQPSRVLMALGLDERASFNSLRLSLGRGNTQQEIDYAVQEIAAAVARLRELHPQGHSFKKPAPH